MVIWILDEWMEKSTLFSSRNTNEYKMNKGHRGRVNWDVTWITFIRVSTTTSKQANKIIHFALFYLFIYFSFLNNTEFSRFCQYICKEAFFKLVRFTIRCEKPTRCTSSFWIIYKFTLYTCIPQSHHYTRWCMCYSTVYACTIKYN